MTNARNFGYRSPLLWVWTLLLGVATIPVLPQKRDSLLSLLGKTHGDSGKVDLLLQLGSVVYGHAPTEALVYCEQAEVLASRSGYRTALAEAHGWLAYLQLNYESRPDIAKSYYEKALLEWTAMLSNISTNPELDSIQVYQGFSNSIINLGYILEQESRYQEALEKYEIGAQLSAKHQLYDHVVACYLNIGNIHKAHGQIETALSRYEEALIVARSHGLIGHEAIALNAIGTLYEDNGFPLSARNYYEQALLIHRHLRDDRFVAVCLNNLGSIAQEMGNLDIAILYYDSASVLTRAIKSWDSYCIYTNNAGSALSLKGKHVEAIQLYRAAVGIATQQDHSRNMSLLHNNIAKSQLAIGLRSSAMASAELANRLAWKGGHVQDIQRSSRTLKEILMAMGRYRDAYRMLLTESKMNDSLVGAEVGRMISRSVIRAEIQEESFRDSASRVVEMSDARFAQERMLLQRKVRSDQARQVAVMSIVLVVVGATAFSLDRRRRKAHHARNAATFKPKLGAPRSTPTSSIPLFRTSTITYRRMSATWPPPFSHASPG
jgi:tetratricopeptide (TPR) repeat protein